VKNFCSQRRRRGHQRSENIRKDHLVGFALFKKDFHCHERLRISTNNYKFKSNRFQSILHKRIHRSFQPDYYSAVETVIERMEMGDQQNKSRLS